MELSVFGLSKYLGVAPSTIERWVKQGKLPVSGKKDTYKFRLDELETWASKNNININFSDKPQEKQPHEESFKLSDAIQNGQVFYDISGGDVSQVLADAVDKISSIPKDFKEDLLQRLIEREEALSTGIGNGFAIPHPREQLSYLKHPAMIICFLENPVEYNALDHQPVSVLFISLCPSLDIHLSLLSALSFCLRNPKFQAFVKSRPEPAQLIQMVKTVQTENSG